MMETLTLEEKKSVIQQGRQKNDEIKAKPGLTTVYTPQ